MLVLYADIKGKNIDTDKLISCSDKVRLSSYLSSKRPDAAKLLASALLKDGLTKFGIEYSSDKTVKNQHGKEYILHGGIFYNISHTDGFACVCISEHECGIDCERVRIGGRYLDVAKRYFTPNEYEQVLHATDPEAMFSKMWTKKESYIKLLGEGFAKPLSEFELMPDDGWACGAYQKTVEVYGTYITCSTRDDLDIKFADKTHEYVI